MDSSPEEIRAKRMRFLDKLHKSEAAAPVPAVAIAPLAPAAETVAQTVPAASATPGPAQLMADRELAVPVSTLAATVAPSAVQHNTYSFTFNFVGPAGGSSGLPSFLFPLLQNLGQNGQRQTGLTPSTTRTDQVKISEISESPPHSPMVDMPDSPEAPEPEPPANSTAKSASDISELEPSVQMPPPAAPAVNSEPEPRVESSSVERADSPESFIDLTGGDEFVDPFLYDFSDEDDTTNEIDDPDFEPPRQCNSRKSLSLKKRSQNSSQNSPDLSKIRNLLDRANALTRSGSNGVGPSSSTGRSALATSTYTPTAAGPSSSTGRSAMATSTYTPTAAGPSSSTGRSAMATSTYTSTAANPSSSTARSAMATSSTSNAAGPSSSTSSTSATASSNLTEAPSTSSATGGSQAAAVAAAPNPEPEPSPANSGLQPGICSICMERPFAVILSCRHLFCLECVKTLKLRKLPCGLCRKPFRKWKPAMG